MKCQYCEAEAEVVELQYCAECAIIHRAEETTAYDDLIEDQNFWQSQLGVNTHAQ